MTGYRLALLTSLLLLAFQTGGTPVKKKTWPVQTKGQEGLREPQEASTLPRRPVVAPRPKAVPALKTRPLLEPRGEGL